MRHPSDTTSVKPGRLREIAALLRRRLENEEGFTLIELTIVLLILGILLTIAVPSYLSFKDRASKTAARADISQTMRSVNAYAADNFPNAANDPDARRQLDEARSDRRTARWWRGRSWSRASACCTRSCRS